MSNTISTKFLILSDTHNFQFGDAEKVNGHLKLPVPKADVVLHCGDLTYSGGVEAYKNVLKFLSQIDAELKLVIAGNHDLDLDKIYVEKRTGTSNGREYYDPAIEVMTGSLAKEAGVIYLEEGVRSFRLRSGARFTVYASPYQPEFCDMAFPYYRDEDRFNMPEHIAPYTKCITQNPIPDFPGIDIMMTHGPPQGILDQVSSGSVGCQALMRGVSRARPLLYCFGHIHEAYGAKVVEWKDGNDKSSIGGEAIQSQKDFVKVNAYPGSTHADLKFGMETLMVNAAIMNIANEPENAPWLVELDLPCELAE